MFPLDQNPPPIPPLPGYGLGGPGDLDIPICCCWLYWFCICSICSCNCCCWSASCCCPGGSVAGFGIAYGCWTACGDGAALIFCIDCNCFERGGSGNQPSAAGGVGWRGKNTYLVESKVLEKRRPRRVREENSKHLVSGFRQQLLRITRIGYRLALLRIAARGNRKKAC